VLHLKKFALAAAISFASLVALPAMAQDTTGPTAPDGSKAFGIKPYVGVLGGYHSFDSRSDFGVSPTSDKMNGWLISGIAGINIPLGPIFIGGEGNATKGFGDINWEYGARARAGFRAGDSGLIFVSGGYQWVNGKGDRGFGERSDWIYGVGVEVGPRDIGLGGITGQAGPRLRLQVETYNFDSIRPMAGVVFHF
jgi:outer membrane immunogenic protein